MPILSYENEISFPCKLNSFSYERMSTKTRFEKEAKGNSEMAYCFVHRGGLCRKVPTLRVGEHRNNKFNRLWKGFYTTGKTSGDKRSGLSCTESS